MLAHRRQNYLTNVFRDTSRIPTSTQQAKFSVLSCRQPQSYMKIRLGRWQKPKLHRIMRSLQFHPGKRHRRITESPRLHYGKGLLQTWRCRPHEKMRIPCCNVTNWQRPDVVNLHHVIMLFSVSPRIPICHLQCSAGFKIPRRISNDRAKLVPAKADKRAIFNQRRPRRAAACFSACSRSCRTIRTSTSPWRFTSSSVFTICRNACAFRSAGR